MRGLHVCSTPGCPELTTTGGKCPECRSEADARRGSARQRGYDGSWERKRATYLRRFPICALCGGLSTVADHYPTSRRDLIAMRVPDPDADHRLRPLCASCHGVQTALHQPGGWNAR